jgi:hypothetical protein
MSRHKNRALLLTESETRGDWLTEQAAGLRVAVGPKQRQGHPSTFPRANTEVDTGGRRQGTCERHLDCGVSGQDMQMSLAGMQIVQPLRKSMLVSPQAARACGWWCLPRSDGV